MVIPDRSSIVNGIIPFGKGDGEPVRTVVTAGIAGTIARERDIAYLDRNSLSQESRLRKRITVGIHDLDRCPVCRPVRQYLIPGAEGQD